MVNDFVNFLCMSIGLFMNSKLQTWIKLQRKKKQTNKKNTMDLTYFSYETNKQTMLINQMCLTFITVFQIYVFLPNVNISTSPTPSLCVL